MQVVQQFCSSRTSLVARLEAFVPFLHTCILYSQQHSLSIHAHAIRQTSQMGEKMHLLFINKKRSLRGNAATVQLLLNLCAHMLHA